nr:hypothetical protein [Microbacterium sp. CBA3102]
MVIDASRLTQCRPFWIVLLKCVKRPISKYSPTGDAAVMPSKPKPLLCSGDGQHGGVGLLRTLSCVPERT